MRAAAGAQGGMSTAHRYCAARWFSQKQSNLCEICSAPAFVLPPGETLDTLKCDPLASPLLLLPVAALVSPVCFPREAAEPGQRTAEPAATGKPMR